jgi:tetratricopeptide (TPR) repeat protein
MKILLALTLSVAGFAATGTQSEVALGRAYYRDGEFRKAAAHFELALRINPVDAEAHYRAGMSYEMLADIATPFDRKYNAKARRHLTRATELAPSRAEYRTELFHFLLDSGHSSRDSIRQALAILSTAPESDPEYASMRRALEDGNRARTSAENRVGGILLAGPRTAYRIAAPPVSIVSRRPAISSDLLP